MDVSLYFYEGIHFVLIRIEAIKLSATTRYYYVKSRKMKGGSV